MAPNVSSFVGDLVEMAKAFEELPSVKEALEQAKHESAASAQAVQAREEAIARYKAEIEELHAKVRATEAQRDDAELRFLELDEKTSKALGSLGNIMANLNDAQSILTPPRPQPEPEPQPQEHDASGWNPNVTPIPADAQHVPVNDSGDVHMYKGQPLPVHHHGDGGNVDSVSSSGQRAVDPTTAPTHDSLPSGATDTRASSASTAESTSTEGVSVPADPTVSSTGGDGHSPGTATPTPSADRASVASSPTQTPMQAEPEDDVGYHNEPMVGLGDGGWTEWDKWSQRMTKRYGTSWPARQLHNVNPAPTAGA